MALFSIGFILIAMTAVRIEQNYGTGAMQVNRTMWASIEAFASALVANTPTLYTLRRPRKFGDSSLPTTGRSNSSVTGAGRYGITVTRSIELEEQSDVLKYPTGAVTRYSEVWNKEMSQEELMRVWGSIHVLH